MTSLFMMGATLFSKNQSKSLPEKENPREKIDILHNRLV